MDDDLVRAQQYRDKAASLREMAAQDNDPVVRRELLSLAGEYDKQCADILRRTKKPN